MQGVMVYMQGIERIVAVVFDRIHQCRIAIQAMMVAVMPAGMRAVATGAGQQFVRNGTE